MLGVLTQVRKEQDTLKELFIQLRDEHFQLKEEHDALDWKHDRLEDENRGLKIQLREELEMMDNKVGALLSCQDVMVEESIEGMKGKVAESLLARKNDIKKCQSCEGAKGTRVRKNRKAKREANRKMGFCK